MKSYTVPLNKMLVSGLRPTTTGQTNGMFLTRCENAQPYGNSLRGMRKILRSFELNMNAQLFETSHEIIVATQSRLYSYSAGELSVLLDSITVGGRWSMADFGDHIRLTNGAVTVVRDYLTGAYSVQAVTPQFTSICRLRGRMFGYVDGIVHWSDIGNIKFLAPDDVETALKGLAGSAPMYDIGDVLRIEPYGNMCTIIYGTGGVVTLTPNPIEGSLGAMKRTLISEIGLTAENAMVAGDLVHYYIGVDLHLYRVYLKGDTIVCDDLDYSEFMSASANLSYNRRERELIVGIPTDSPFLLGNSYILNRYGMSSISSYVQDLIYTKSGEVVAHSPSRISQQDCFITSDILNFDIPGHKTIDWIEIFGVIPDTIYVNVSTKHDVGVEFTNKDWVPLNQQGVAYLGETGIEHKIHIAIPNYTLLDIQRIAVTFTPVDRRFMMGARTDYGNKTVAEPNS